MKESRVTKCGIKNSVRTGVAPGILSFHCLWGKTALAELACLDLPKCWLVAYGCYACCARCLVLCQVYHIILPAWAQAARLGLHVRLLGARRPSGAVQEAPAGPAWKQAVAAALTRHAGVARQASRGSRGGWALARGLRVRHGLLLLLLLR